MKKSTVLTICFLLLATGVWGGHHTPEDEGIGPDYQARIALLTDLGDWNTHFDIEGRMEDAGREFRYRSMTAGAFWRAHRNLKVGALYRLQAGARHDDDWLALDGNDWAWKDSRERYEHLFMLDATPRFLLGRSGVAAAKLRYEYNMTNNQQIILLRPGYTWFHMVDREPRWNLSLNYALYFSLNFGDSVLYESGPYLSWLYHLSDLIKVEVRGDYITRTWSSSEDSIAAGDTYLMEDRRIVLGVGILLTPRF